MTVLFIFKALKLNRTFVNKISVFIIGEAIFNPDLAQLQSPTFIPKCENGELFLNLYDFQPLLCYASYILLSCTSCLMTTPVLINVRWLRNLSYSLILFRQSSFKSKYFVHFDWNKVKRTCTHIYKVDLFTLVR